ncbi:hypothetical protein SKAU_G00240120 [Synaphobranchus kaupii]|uniref:Uncharacterized protein n=1 Tax=Synaphobranchus kaupii TaxID=118154 RepID=A0A9Q1F7V3_SYNKA|nr:hypothetical protein SKAU_G00240120 [Synaphobranchus kaupii]
MEGSGGLREAWEQENGGDGDENFTEPATPGTSPEHSQHVGVYKEKSRLQQEDWKQEDWECLLRPPVEPSAMFGSDSVRMLRDVRYYAGTMSSCDEVSSPSTIADLQQREVLQAEVTLLLSKGAIREGGATARENLQFLQEQLDAGKSSTTVRVLVAVIKPAQVGDHRLTEGCCATEGFRKGAQRLTARIFGPCPVSVAPPTFDPLESIDLKWLSFKTVFLLAVTSARRLGENCRLYLSIRTAVHSCRMMLA